KKAFGGNGQIKPSNLFSGSYGPPTERGLVVKRQKLLAIRREDKRVPRSQASSAGGRRWGGPEFSWCVCGSGGESLAVWRKCHRPDFQLVPLPCPDLVEGNWLSGNISRLRLLLERSQLP